ncbi:hypothetical protein AB0D08_11095 [Kitasatospora sp. NPDC048540]|uniref:hypothetical protein n=1 Tax=Kitasatospora sp. NPDC048540 TaxID=3155634 RepID=UPI0033D475BB
MFGATRCPVGPEERAWIEESLAWLLAEFGPEVLLRPPVLPTAEHFPGPFDGSPEQIRALVVRLCGDFGVDPDGLSIEIEEYDPQADRMAAELGLTVSSSGAAGHFRIERGRPVVAVGQEQAARPLSLVATIAHELGHVRLIAERRTDPDRPDGEPLTDLLTVFFGFGVFNANAAFTRTVDGDRISRHRLGYLPQEAYGYALACYAHLRGEARPGWAAHLDTNPRGYLRQGARFLRHHPLPFTAR